jgi:hypothetical protein
MAEPETTDEAVVPETTDKRERSTIVFPYGDLDEAISIATAIQRNVGTAQCDLDQVAGWMNQTVTSGAFRTKVNSARIFGLVKTGQSKLALTALGHQIVDPETEAAARVDAFLNVPLYNAIFTAYKGGALPPTAVGLERHMAELGVAPKQTDKARQAFQRSAQQAGFFREGNNKLVRPGFAPVETHTDRNGGGGDGGDGGDTSLHPLIEGLVKTLPAAQTAWPETEQAEWIEAAKAIFKLIYKNQPSGAATPSRSNESQQPS